MSASPRTRETRSSNRPPLRDPQRLWPAALNWLTGTRSRRDSEVEERQALQHTAARAVCVLTSPARRSRAGWACISTGSESMAPSYCGKQPRRKPTSALCPIEEFPRARGPERSKVYLSQKPRPQQPGRGRQERQLREAAWKWSLQPGSRRGHRAGTKPSRGPEL